VGKEVGNGSVQTFVLSPLCIQFTVWIAERNRVGGLLRMSVAWVSGCTEYGTSIKTSDDRETYCWLQVWMCLRIPKRRIAIGITKNWNWTSLIALVDTRWTKLTAVNSQWLAEDKRSEGEGVESP